MSLLFCSNLSWETLGRLVVELPPNQNQTHEILDDMALWGANSDSNTIKLIMAIGLIHKDHPARANVKYLLDAMAKERTGD